MKYIIVAAISVIGIVLGQDSTSGIKNKYVSQEKYLEIKAKTSTWEPYKPEEHPFKHLTDEEINMRMGLKVENPDMGLSHLFKEAKSMIGSFGLNLDQASGLFDKLHNPFSLPKKTISLPASFDPRAVSSWTPCIHAVREQYQCGSCWAHAAAGMLEDRLCIASNQNINVRLAPQDMVNCDYNSAGCSGGYSTAAVSYLIEEGVVSEACLPYKAAMSPSCTYQCDDPTIEYKKYYCKIGSMRILTNFDEIKAELIINGPMMVGFEVFDDFGSYSSGIYHPTSTTNTIFRHTVKLLGWGLDGSNKLYWLCQNSWGTWWGESGFFRIYSGSVGIDSVAFACLPDI